jgi:hypothetical protein
MRVGVAIAAALVLAGLAAALWVVWRRWLQFCPHCGWPVPRVHHAWRRCTRCHKQYGRHHGKLKLH